VMGKSLNAPPKMPKELIAVMFTDSRGFVCKNCIKDDENIDNEDICTAILDHDDWFTGESCTRCHNFIPPGG